MMAKCSVFIATSLDGFIAREDGTIDWLENASATAPPGEDCGYADFIKTIDYLVMGRNTFELVSSFPEWPYKSTRVHVLSSTMFRLPSGMPDTVTLSHEAPTDLVQRLSKSGAKRLYIDGGITIQCFLQNNLIDDITITRIPILLGAGRTLFGPIGHDIQLKHVSTKTYPFGFVQDTYQVLPDEEI